MAIRHVVVEGDEILRKKCREVTEVTDRIKMTLEDMLEVAIAAFYIAMGERSCDYYNKLADEPENPQPADAAEPHENAEAACVCFVV